MIQRDRPIRRWVVRIDSMVRNPLGNGRGHDEPARILMILHVIRGRMRKNDRGIHCPHHRGDFCKRGSIVKNAQILKQGRMHGGS